MKIKEVRFRDAVILPNGTTEYVWRNAEVSVDKDTRELVRVLDDDVVRVPLDNVVYRRSEREKK